MPKLSIVVPTRERADTLLHTLRTLVSQDYQFCEIIVSDNASEDGTKEIVESFTDARIRYINTGKRVSMSDNWEFALKHVSGDFVTYIGDDDGFLPGAVTSAMRLLEETGQLALVWDKVEYCWPDYADENMRNWFSLKSGNKSLQVVASRSRLEKVMKFREGYSHLPCLYNGIIRMSCLKKVIACSENGLFFNAIAPDVFSGIALSTVVERYLLTDYPFSINGASSHSNGSAFVRRKVQNEGVENNNPTQKFMSENSRAYDARIKMAPSVSVCIMGEFLLVKQFFPTLPLPEPDWNFYVKALLRNAKKSLAFEEILLSAEHTVKKLNLRIKMPSYSVDDSKKSKLNLGFTSAVFNFKAPLSMVGNVFDACHLVGGMLPPPVKSISKSPIKDFFKNLKDFLVPETIKLFRSL